MSTPDDVIARIHAAFGGNDYPGDRWLQGSTDGHEPAEEVGPFVGRTRWDDIDPAVLDAHYAALSFFSEAGFRFFLPAFLVADLHGQLLTAEPLSHLTGGFSNGAIESPVGGQTFVRRFGASTFVNPRRYGAATFEDYARYRLSIFTREEAGAIVAYLELKRDLEAIEALRRPIDLALGRFWRERAATAPTAQDLRAHLDEERAYLDALRRQG
jgi:hypothetical protein